MTLADVFTRLRLNLLAAVLDESERLRLQFCLWHGAGSSNADRLQLQTTWAELLIGPMFMVIRWVKLGSLWWMVSHVSNAPALRPQIKKEEGEQKQEKKTEGLHPRLELPSFNAQPRPQSMELEMAFCWHYNERSMVSGETGDLCDPWGATEPDPERTVWR